MWPARGQEACSLAGFWLAIYLASHHPGCWIGAEPIEWSPRGIVQLKMTWEGQLAVVQSNCFEHRPIGQQREGVTACSCWHVTVGSCVRCVACLGRLRPAVMAASNSTARGRGRSCAAPRAENHVELTEGDSRKRVPAPVSQRGNKGPALRGI